MKDVGTKQLMTEFRDKSIGTKCFKRPDGVFASQWLFKVLQWGELGLCRCFNLEVNKHSTAFRSELGDKVVLSDLSVVEH